VYALPVTILELLLEDSNNKQDKQCKVNITLGRIRATTVALEKQ
jgi:subtilisin-like proprotein convertase family protein